MTTSSDGSLGVENLPDTVLHQSVLGSRRLSNVLVALVVSLGGFGFSLASLSSRFGLSLLPAIPSSTIPWLPQGLVMGLYGIAALLLAFYLWLVIFLDLGGGSNEFDKLNGLALITRKGLRQLIRVELPLRDIQAVKVEIRDGLSPQRRLTLRIKGRRDLPLSRIGEPVPLADLESTGAKLARFLGVPLEGL